MFDKFTYILFILLVFIFYSLVMYEGGRLAGFTEAAVIFDAMFE